MKKNFALPSLKMAFLIAALASVSMYAACKKSSTAAPQKFKIASDSTVCGPSNPNNPEDSVGGRHNLYLDTMIVGLDTSVSVSTLLNICESYSNIHNLPWSQNEISTVTPIINNINLSIFISGNYKLYVQQNISNLNISAGAMAYLDTLFFTTLDSANYASNYTYCDVRNNIVSLETRISQSTLSTSDKNLLLGACSVARYSSYNIPYEFSYLNIGNNNNKPNYLDSVMWGDIFGWVQGYNDTGDADYADMIASIASGVVLRMNLPF